MKNPDEFNRSNHIPGAPVDERWPDKERDHWSSQLQVPLAARLAGASGGQGCPTNAAMQAVSDAEENFYKRQEKPLKVIEEKIVDKT